MSAPYPPRPPRIAVIGAGVATDTERAAAEEVGRRLGAAGAVVVCGGRGGVMEAVAKGAAGQGALCVGVLPGGEAHEANPWIALPLATGLGEARNVLVVRAAEAVIAIAGSWGTLSEIALARKVGRPVVTLGTPPAEGLGLDRAKTPDEAVTWALREAAVYRQRVEGATRPAPPEAGGAAAGRM